jgi:uracil phosphoribosyltransferase
MAASLPDNVRVSHHPLVEHKLTILRNKETEPKRFRELVRELAALLTYEAMADWAVNDKHVETPMASFKGTKIELPIIVPILRAGLGMSDGALDGRGFSFPGLGFRGG